MNYFLLIIFAAFVFSSCSNSQDSLDAIRQFKKDDHYFKAGLVSLHFIIETSPTGKVDTVFNSYLKEFNLPVTAEGCKDGIYAGESPYDAYDYKHAAKVKIENEKVISIDYNEIYKYDEHGKEEDSVYCEEMSPSGTTPAIAYPDMEKQLLRKQDITKVDAISGATYSLYRFRYAVIVALMKARIANEKTDN